MLKDPWFRGLDLITGPDGQVWMNDWSDTGECHDNDGIHRTSGRIYRIVYDGPDKGRASTGRPEWLTRHGRGEVTDADIEKMLSSPDEGKRAMAIRWFSENLAKRQVTPPLLKVFTQEELFSSGLARLEMAAALQRLPEE